MRRLAISMLAAALCAAPAAGDEPSTATQYGETMTVVRYILEARVTDSAGRAVPDIPAGEFEVRIGKARAHVESADWIGTAPADAEQSETTATGSTPAASAGAAEAAAGRNIVFFVQTDFGRNRDRILGQMAFMANLADKVVAMLPPADRIAVVSFDSHLKLRSDFTTDRDATLEAIRGSIDIDEPGAPAAPRSGSSLFAAIDTKAAKKVATSEWAFLQVAQALRRVEGERLMFLAGWGFGDMIWGPGGTSKLVLPRAWSDAVGLLHRDHVPVITIGTGTGELTLGIAMTARATGGLHTSAIDPFPEQTLVRIEGALAGYYELVLRMDSPLTPGEYPITIRAKDPRWRVRATPTIVIDAVDTRYEEAIALINAGEVAQGVQALRESMASGAIPADVLVERLLMFVDAAQWEAALAVIERLEADGAIDDEVAGLRDEAMKGAAARTRMRAQTILTEARQALLVGDEGKALALLEQAIATEPNLAEPWFERGMLLLARGKTDDAKTSLKRYLELDPRGANASTAKDVLASFESE
jgi:tetratricopeptide (TPR) repeat protein